MHLGVQTLLRGSSLHGAHGLWYVLDVVLDKPHNVSPRAVDTLVRIVCFVLGQMVDRMPERLEAAAGNPPPEQARARSNTIRAIFGLIQRDKSIPIVSQEALRTLHVNAAAIAAAHEPPDAAEADAAAAAAAAAAADEPAADGAIEEPQPHENDPS